MSATRDLIAAALTAADDLGMRNFGWVRAEELREACARAMVQPAAPDMAEVERLLLYFEKRAPWVRHKQRAALLDYVRGVMVERDDLIHDNERLMQISAQEVSVAPQPVSEEPCSIKQPTGWRCTRAGGHEGPCAAVEDRS